MPDFIPSGPLGDFYKGSMAPPLRMPDGSFQQAPSPYQGPTSLGQIYAGIYGTQPTTATGSAQLTNNPINVVSVDTRGNPITGNANLSPYPTMQAGGGYGGGQTVNAATPLDGSRLGLGYGNGASSTPPGIQAIDQQTTPQVPVPQQGGNSIFGIQLPQIPSVPSLLADAGQGLGNAGNYISNQVQSRAPGIAKAIIPAVMQSLPARSAFINGFLRQSVDANRNAVAASMPDRGQKIQTNNNGTQIIGQRLNGSPRGRTVTNDSWFNSVTGL